MNIKADMLYCIVLMNLAGNREISDFENRFSRMGRLLVHDQLDGSSDHHATQFFRRRVADIDRADALAFAQDRNPVSYFHDLIELMGNEQDRLPLFGQILHDLHEFFNFLRCQYCRRLIEDQDVIVPVEHLENLGSLLHAYGDILDLRIRIYRKAIALAELHDFLSGFLLLQDAMLRGFYTEHDVFKNGEYLDQLEVLMNHANAISIGIIRIIDLHFFSIQLDDSFFRLNHSEQYGHQG